jgi:transposase
LIDSQATKNTDSAYHSWFCHYKCTNGIKRHLLVDVLWIPMCVKVTTADISDREGGIALIEKNKKLLIWIKNMLADNGYAGEKFKISIKDATWIIVTVTPKPTSKEWEAWFKPEHKRRIVERSNARMDKCRRLHKNNEWLIDTSEAMILLCFIRLVVRRLSWRNTPWKWSKKI